jgi:glucuronoarabinoxylan endo-1,4-beta-xylanase
MQYHPTRMPGFAALIVLFALSILWQRGASADSRITVYISSPQQTIAGFGASDAWQAGSIRWLLTTSQQAQVLDMLFSQSTGIGLSLLRHRIPTEIEPAKGQWDWTQDSDAVWLTGEAVNRGLTMVWATPWSPPAWMKTNDDVNNGGALDPAHYLDYATYLSQYIQQYKSKFGITIAAVSLQNEPDIVASYESCNWTGQQFHDFIKNALIPTFRQNGVTAKVMLPEFSGWQDTLAAETLADPITAQFIQVIATHDYWETITPFTDAIAQGKAVWETEVSNLGANDASIYDGLHWAMQVHNALTIGGVNAWHYWWLINTDPSGQALINLVPSGSQTTIQVNKRLWTIGNFSRFVRPGAQMVALSSNNPEPDVYTTAFVQKVYYSYQNLSVVAINNSDQSKTLTVQFPNLSWPRVFPYRTSASEDLIALPKIMPSGGKLSYVLPPRSVTTFTGLGKALPAAVGAGI